MPEHRKTLDEWIKDEVMPHESDLRNWVRSRFATLQDVDDLIQESYWRLSRAYMTGPIANARAYLFATTRNLALKRLRKFQIENPLGVMRLDPDLIPDYSQAPSESVSRSDEILILNQAIQSLPKRCRQIMILRKIYGLTAKQTASRLNLSFHTVEAQTRIGLAKCSRFLKQKGYIQPNTKPHNES